MPALGDGRFWDSVPEWCELVVHGWEHPDPYECSQWSKERMEDLIFEIETNSAYNRFALGFKAPGWQISDGCYEALAEAQWWVADQHYNDDRRPPSLYYHCEGDGDHWHGHIQDVCGNGIEETWDELSERVRAATSFQFVSEATRERPDASTT